MEITGAETLQQLALDLTKLAFNSAGLSFFFTMATATILTFFFFPLLSRSQRSDIVKAAYEPTDEECEWKADEEEELTVSKQVQVTYTPACLSPVFHHFFQFPPAFIFSFFFIFFLYAHIFIIM